MAPALNRKRTDPAAQIPDRLYFKISDVASICGIAASVLRFWETQFPQLKPNKSGTGQRLYRRRDVELVLEIKSLVYDAGYTLAGARQALGTKPSQSKPAPVAQASPESMPMAAPNPAAMKLPDESVAWCGDAVAATVGHARAELRALLGVLGQPEPQRRRPKLRVQWSDVATLFPVE